MSEKALYSRFVQRLHRRYDGMFDWLPPGLPDQTAMQAVFDRLRGQNHDIGSALRMVRQLVLERLIRLDCDCGASVQDITACMTTLAEFALNTACDHAFQQLDTQYGQPLKPDGTRANFWIVGMGKLGARELNVSSDIDLVYLYDVDGETTVSGVAVPASGEEASAAHRACSIGFSEYFSRAVKYIHNLIGETTEHGFVFRIDLALRPHGNSGPAVCSLEAFTQYLQAHGREWERFAWMKSRIVAPRASIENHSGRQLRRVVLPFVFRRYLDYNVYESLRVLHDQIRDHAVARSAGRPERANDVKISRGGIREIEFIVQLLQVVRGGQFPELRVRSTLEGLVQLARAGCISQPTADALAQAYIFLRRAEHRIQYLDDQQTHILPVAEADLLWIAQTMGYADIAAFMQELLLHRDIVAREFDKLLSRSGADEICGGDQCKKGLCALCQPALGQKQAAPNTQLDRNFEELAPLLAQEHTALQERLHAWQANTRIAALNPRVRERLWQLMQYSLRWLANAPDKQGATEAGVLRFMDWLETLIRKESYLALLQERPAVQAHVLQILSRARWPARHLARNPGVVDELANQAMLGQRFDAQAFKQTLQLRLQSLQSTGEDDEESLLILLRRAMYAETFRTLARDLDGRLSVEAVADDLSALADAVLDIAIRWCWQRLQPKAQALGMAGITSDMLSDHFAIIAYGKLGGLELGYGGDLDLVFLYEDSHDRAGEMYTALVRKLILWLTTNMGEGPLYEIDTALRPNGNSGLLTTTVNAFESYQLQRGSNTAWVWEHQAMTRARCCFGSERLRERFESIRTAVLTAERDAHSLRKEIVAMRERVRQAHAERPGSFDLKHSAGGMIDAEFVTQYLVLLHSKNQPAMLENRGNITLLERADDLELLPAGKRLGHAAATAYRFLRGLQHRARLNEEAPQCPPQTVQAQAEAIQSLWRATLGAALETLE